MPGLAQLVPNTTTTSSDYTNVSADRTSLPTHLKLDVAADAAGAARTLDPENGVTLGVTDVELGLADAPALFDVADGFARRRLHFHFLWK